MNKKTVLHATFLLLPFLAVGGNSVQADDHGAYWTGAGEKMWRNGFGDCWRPGSLPSEGKDCGMAKEEPVLDTDGDGVPNIDDKCPGTPPGVTVDSDGCPLDSDGDGVNDDLDKCPGTPPGTTVGTNGCPLDSDGDGVYDDVDQCPGTPAGVEVEANGCPKVGETLMVLQGVNFEFDSAALTNDAKSQLDQAATTLNANSLVNVKVVGHTDSRGSENYNQGLSERRAAAVVNYLTANGVSSSRLTSEGMGEVNPIADNSTEEGRYRNRRVEFIVVE